MQARQRKLQSSGSTQSARGNENEAEQGTPTAAPMDCSLDPVDPITHIEHLVSVMGEFPPQASQEESAALVCETRGNGDEGAAM